MNDLKCILKKIKEKKESNFFSKITIIFDTFFSKIKETIFSVNIKNIEDVSPKIDLSSLKIPDEVRIKNIKDIADYIKIPEQKEFPKKIEVSNLSEVSKYFEFFKNIKIPNSFSIKNINEIPSIVIPENLKKLSLEKSEKYLLELIKVISSSNKIKENKNVFVKNKKPEEYIPVRIVDKKGKDWLESFGSSLLAYPSQIYMQDSSGNKINPAIKENQSPLNKYIIQDKQTSSTITYYGFASSDGHWYIMKKNTSDGTYRFASGSSNYATNFSKRASLEYDYIFNVSL